MLPSIITSDWLDWLPPSSSTCHVESVFVSLKAPSYSPNTLRATWFYLCHHISLSGGKVPLMTQRLLALCFGLPVNAGHADGISHSLRDQFTITIIVFCRQAAMKPIWAASLSGEMVCAEWAAETLDRLYSQRWKWWFRWRCFNFNIRASPSSVLSATNRGHV